MVILMINLFMKELNQLIYKLKINIFFIYLYNMIKDYISLNDFVDKYNLNDIITNDFDAWSKIKNYNFIYNKLWIAQSQNIESGPMGIEPESYPIIFKPIINLYGMSRGFRLINNKKEYEFYLKDGLFWMKYLNGKFYCIDIVIVNGLIKFYSCLQSFSNNDGTFKYHESLPNYILSDYIKEWIENNLEGYTGCFNIEVIDDKIIEAHLRFNGDFYLYNLNFMKNVNDIYLNKSWNITNYKIPKIFLFPIFVKKSFNIYNLDIDLILSILDKYNSNSLRIDNINSMYQGNELSRLFMFDVYAKNDGLNASKDIYEILHPLTEKL
jgi:hypothetical protein